MRSARALPTIAVFLLACTFFGCASPRTERDSDQWLARHGGTLEDATRQRAIESASPLLCAFPRITLRVIDDPQLAAYSWPDGTVAVTRGLAEALDPPELAAAVAHELGHLISDGWLTTPATLTGSAASADAESRADAIAVQLLQSRGLPEAPLASALQKVMRATKLPPDQHRAVQARIDHLQNSKP